MHAGELTSFKSADAHLPLLSAAEAALRCAPTLQRCALLDDVHLPSSAAICAMRITHFSTCWEDSGVQLAAEEVEGLLRSLAALSATAGKVAVLHTAATGRVRPAAAEPVAASLAGPAVTGAAADGGPAAPGAAQGDEAAELAPRLLGTARYCWVLAQALVRRVVFSEHGKRCEAAIPAACLVGWAISWVGAVPGDGMRQRQSMLTLQDSNLIIACQCPSHAVWCGVCACTKPRWQRACCRCAHKIFKMDGVII